MPLLNLTEFYFTLELTGMIRRESEIALQPGTLKMVRWIGVSCLIWLFSTQVVQAADPGPLITTPTDVRGSSVQVFEDPSAQLTLDEVVSQRQTFKEVYQPTPNYWYSASAYWFHFSVQNQSPETKTLYLSVEQTLLDYLTLYVLHGDNQRETIATGDRIPFSRRPFPTTTMSMPFHLKAGETAELYLRIHSDSSVILVPMKVLDEDEIIQYFSSQRMLRGFTQGLFFALFIYNLFVFILLRERAYFYYLIYLLFSYLGISAKDGPASMLWNPDWTWPSNDGVVVLCGISFIFVLLFTREFLRAVLNRRLNYWLIGMIGTSVFLTLSPYFLPLRTSYKILSMTLFFLPLFSMGVGAVAWKKGMREMRFFIVSQLATWLGLLAHALVTSDVIPYYNFHNEAISLGLGTDALLLSLALADRIRVWQAAKRVAEDNARQNLILRQDALEQAISKRTAELQLEIAERAKTERAWRETSQFTEAIISNASEGILVLDRELRFALWNKAMQRLTGIQAEKILGKPIFDVLPELKTSEREANYRRALAGETFTSPDYHIQTRGREFWWSNSYAPQYNDQGEIIGVISLTHDISARKKAEKELQDYAARLAQTNQELDERGRELGAAIKLAKAATQAKSEFLANMSHEIRTPMNGVIGMTELALETDLTEEQREYLSTVKSSANGLLTVLNDILDFSKIEAGKLEIDAAPFSLRETLSSTLKTLAVRAHEKNLELICDIDAAVPDVLIGDPARLRQIVINLIGNGIKFTAHGEVGLRVRLESLDEQCASVACTVYDTGIGIPADRLDKIFAAFEQVDASTTRKYGGTGLGLAITTQLVNLMGGNIRVESEIGKGSQFHFSLALKRGSVLPEPSASPLALAHKRVLVVDDNVTNRRVLAGYLKNLGIEGVLAASGPGALLELKHALERQRAFDLVLLDGQMPEMDGFAVAQAIRATPGIQETPIILLTSAIHQGAAARSLELGIAARLTKPALPTDLLRAITSTINRAEAEIEQRIPIAPQHTPLETHEAPLRILLVDDNGVNRQLGRRVLEKRGHTVRLAENGLEAVALYQAEIFDLVLMDVQMPEMNGFEATAEIRRLESSLGSRVPIIAMTAMAMKGDRDACLAAGMDEYITKPLRIAELTARIVSLMDRQAGQPQSSRLAAVNLNNVNSAVLQ